MAMVANLTDKINAQYPVVILSPESGASDDIARRRSLNGELTARGIPFADCTGCYKGELEYSVAFKVDGVKIDLDTAADIARSYDQESILYLTGDHGDGRQAVLVYVDRPGRPQELIGAFKAVPARRAKRQDAYTYVHELDQFYIAE
jgi:hypothetical protein